MFKYNETYIFFPTHYSLINKASTFFTTVIELPQTRQINKILCENLDIYSLILTIQFTEILKTQFYECLQYTSTSYSN